MTVSASNESYTSLEQRCQTIVRWVVTILVAVPLLVLIGWATNIQPLKSLVAGMVAMNPVTAICFILTAGTLYISSHNSSRLRAVSYTLACLIVAVALIRLTGYFGGFESGVDRLLFSARLQEEAIPNRMAPNTAVAFLTLGIALICNQRSDRDSALGQFLAAGTGLIGVTTIFGYFLREFNGARIGTYIPMALHTGVLFTAAALGTLLSRPEGRISCVVLSTGMAGKLARKLLLAALAIPVLLELLQNASSDHHWFNPQTGVAIALILNITIMSVLVWISCSSTMRSELDLQEAERLAVEAQHEAERANLAKSEFLSRMSHELRTPMNSVLGFAQILELEGLEARQQECVDQILKGGRHLLRLINEVLDISKIEVGHISLSREPVELRAILNEAVSLMMPVADAEGITMNLAIEVTGEIHVFADRQRLLQVMLNLISNAIKYNKPHGQVDITANLNGGIGVTVRVVDTGTGISKDHLDLLFTPFARLGADATGIEGSGLGLALSKGLADAMGGSLTYEDNPVGGSIFVLDLAHTESPMSALEGKSIYLHPIDLGHDEVRSVLLIEDNKANIELMQELLSMRTNVELIVAMKGSLGIELAFQHIPDLIFLDLNLPDLDGADILRALRADVRTAKTPVVVTSADATTGQIARLKKAGATDYLTKPLEIAEVLAVVDQLFYEPRRRSA